MLKFRIIARCDIRNDRLIRRVRCEGVRPVGDPQTHATACADAGADELLFNDCVASLYGRNGLSDMVDRVTTDVFIPVTVAGGIRTEDDVRMMLNSGADKIAINTAAIENPSVIDRLATKFGSSTISLQLDAKRRNGGWEAFCGGARTETGRCAVEWAREAVARGAGEIVATSIDHDGRAVGVDVPLLRALATLPVPVVISGGFRAADDAAHAYHAGASGIALSSALHHNVSQLISIKQHLAASGVPVRCESSFCAYSATSALSRGLAGKSADSETLISSSRESPTAPAT